MDNIPAILEIWVPKEQDRTDQTGRKKRVVHDTEIGELKIQSRVGISDQ